jgi:ParD-like antitoxin of type II bacterial toxin-antitoxin system
MGQPVKVSEALVLDARLMGEATQRSIAGQIEFWARLGRAVETLLRGDQVLALCKAGKARPLSACLQLVDSPEGRKRLAAHLKTLPFPHYEPARGGLLVKIEADGKRTTGRFINRKFQPLRAATR